MVIKKFKAPPAGLELRRKIYESLIYCASCGEIIRQMEYYFAHVPHSRRKPTIKLYHYRCVEIPGEADNDKA